MDHKFTLIGHEIGASFSKERAGSRRYRGNRPHGKNADQVRTNHNVWIYLRAILPHNKLQVDSQNDEDETMILN